VPKFVFKIYIVYNENEVGMLEDPNLIYEIERKWESKKNFNLLGILLDEYLSFNDHIGKLCSKIVKSLFCINRGNSVINPMYEYSKVVEGK